MNKDSLFDLDFNELKGLIEACDYTLVDSITQNVSKIDFRFFIGSGKLSEIKMMVDLYEVDVVIFNQELSGIQTKNLEKFLEVLVIDRTQLILNIFSSRAKTKEAKLQVKIASLKYLMPRLVGSHQELGRQSGGGFSNKGLGEKQIDLDKRKIQRMVALLEEELINIANVRTVKRKKRIGSSFNVCLVGYTNVGKSSLMNRISKHKEVEVKDQLFATLDAHTRNIKYSKLRNYNLIDTVGFIANLPTNLIKSFRSTLEEIVNCDLIIHVIDFSNPNFLLQVNTVNETLVSIGIKGTPIVNVYNKVDNVSFIPENNGKDFYVSVKQNLGIKELEDFIVSSLFSNFTEVTEVIDSSLLGNYYANYEVLDVVFSDENNVSIKYLKNN